MKKRYFFLTLTSLLAMSLSACGNDTTKSTTPAGSKATSKATSSVEEGPRKTVTVSSISLGTQSNKAYITVTGTHENYEPGEFKWAWGLMDTSGNFDYGKENPTEADFTAVAINSANFTVKLCLTDIQTLVAGKLYRIYGGTPESYNDIPFASNQFGARDDTRNYYLRQDQDNALTFDNIQPITFTKASVVNVETADLPTGVTQTGAYVKFGGANSKNLTMDTIKAWDDAGHIAGNFQRVIGGGYSLHAHEATERFYKIEGNDVFFYLYVGFIAEGEGWMVHFDVVSGNENAGLNMGATFNGETSYTVGDAEYKVYADSGKSGEENYWGCLGVYRVGEANQ